VVFESGGTDLSVADGGDTFRGKGSCRALKLLFY
jgi:hypothetical protein